VTHAYIVFVVSIISQFWNSPYQDHWDVVIWILKYVKKTLRKYLIYKDKENTQIGRYSDVD